MYDPEDDEAACLDRGNPDNPCAGIVEFRYPLSGTGRSFPRCEHHWDERLATQERINDTYGPDSDIAPSWFHRSWGGANEYGEYWDESDY